MKPAERNSTIKCGATKFIGCGAWSSFSASFNPVSAGVFFPLGGSVFGYYGQILFSFWGGSVFGYYGQILFSFWGGSVFGYYG